MFKKIAYAGVFVGLAAVATVVGCGDGGTTTGNKDFATGGNGDMPGGNNDMNVTKMYKAATPNEIDTNQIGGDFGKGTAVTLSGVIVISPISGFSANMDKDCRYQVFVQDPSCSAGPCGLVIVTAAIANPNGTGAFCGFQGSDATPLKNVKAGDKIDVKGVVDTFASTAMSPATGTVVQHEVEIDELTTVSTGQTLPAFTVVTDTDPSLFKPYSGTGWAMYEGMRVTVKPATGKFTTTLDSFGGWDCAPGGAHFADTYTGLFRPDGAAANMWPPTGSMFTSISGVVSLTFGGGILPTSNADFAP